jgi:hypothetical protein
MFTVLMVSFLVRARPAFAAEGGVPSADAAADTATNDAASSGSGAPPLACDGALCDTTNGSTCGVSPRARGVAHVDSEGLALIASCVAIALARRAKRGARRPILACRPR